jgi:hypothetical protein
MSGEDGGEGGGFWGFWTTLPGVLSGVAAVLTASGALAGIILARNDEGGDGPSVAAGVATSPPPPSPPSNPPPVPPVSPPAASLADWRREANSLCANSNRELRAMFGRPPQGPEELVLYYQGALPVITRLAIDLRGLDTPGDRAEEIAELLDGLEAQNANAQEALAAWQAGNTPAFQRAAAEVGRASNSAAGVAASLGARECALGPFG